MLILISHSISHDLFVALEQPQDPATYVNPSPHDLSAPTMWEWPAIKTLIEHFGWRVATFDQAALGALHPTPTMLMTSSWDLHVLLHARTVPSSAMQRGESRAAESHWERWYQEEVAVLWAPGLTLAILKCWDVWLSESREQRATRAYEQSYYVSQETDGQHEYLKEARHWLAATYGQHPAEVVPRLRISVRMPSGSRAPARPIILPRVASLKLSSAEMEYKRHCERGHWPFRRDCRECLQAAGKSRPLRRRPPTSDAYTLAVDLAGPYVRGLSEVAHLETMPRPRYLFVGVYMFPVDADHKLLWEISEVVKPETESFEVPLGVDDGVPISSPSAELDPEAGQPGVQPGDVTADEDIGDLVGQSCSDVVDPESGKPGVKPGDVTEDEGVDHPVETSGCEPLFCEDELLDYSPSLPPDPEPPLPPPHEAPGEVSVDDEWIERGYVDESLCPADERYLSDVDKASQQWKDMYASRCDGVNMQKLIFTDVLVRRTQHETSGAIRKVLVRLRQLGFPVFRLHSDRGGEFVNRSVRKLTMDHDLLHTATESDNPGSNGHAEQAVGAVKRGIRARLHEDPGYPEVFWSLAARDVGAVLNRQVLSRFDSSLRPLLPWGCRVHVREKSFSESHWSSRMIPGCVVGPSELTPRGYVIALEPLSDGKVLVSTTVRHRGELSTIPTTLPGEIWNLDLPSRRHCTKRGVDDVVDGAERLELDDLAVVGGEVHRLESPVDAKSGAFQAADQVGEADGHPKDHCPASARPIVRYIRVSCVVYATTEWSGSGPMRCPPVCIFSPS